MGNENHGGPVTIITEELDIIQSVNPVTLLGQ